MTFHPSIRQKSFPAPHNLHCCTSQAHRAPSHPQSLGSSHTGFPALPSAGWARSALRALALAVLCLKHSSPRFPISSSYYLGLYSKIKHGPQERCVHGLISRICGCYLIRKKVCFVNDIEKRNYGGLSVWALNTSQLPLQQRGRRKLDTHTQTESDMSMGTETGLTWPQEWGQTPRTGKEWILP